MAIDLSNLVFPVPGEFRLWHERELFKLSTAKGNGPWEMPNEDDIIITLDQGMQRVVDVDKTTGTYTVDYYNPYGVLVTDPRLEQSDPDLVSLRLLGSGHGVPTDALQCYLDSTVWPYTLAMPSTLYCTNPTVSYYKIFLGTDYTEANGIEISRYYNAGGELISNCIPMRRNRIDVDASPYCYCATGNCSMKLATNQTVSLVAYSSDGRIAEVRYLRVLNTDVAKRVEAAADAILGVKLVGMSIPEGADRDILLPQGSTFDSLGLQCQVTLRSGTVLTLPLDGTKVAVLGNDAFTSERPGSTYGVTLAYTLDDTEINDTTLALTATGKLVDNYTVNITTANDDLTTKVFVLPSLISEVEGYGLGFVLMNTARSLSEVVTDIVTVEGFDGQLYDEEQVITVQLQMSDVSLAFATSIQTYLIRITLRDPTDDAVASWSIRYEEDLERTLESVETVSATQETDGNWTYDISLGHGGSASWLNTLYWPSSPLYNATNEAGAPTPNRFRVTIGGVGYDRALEDYASTITSSIGVANNGSISVEFYKLSGSTELRLGATALKVKR